MINAIIIAYYSKIYINHIQYTKPVHPKQIFVTLKACFLSKLRQGILDFVKIKSKSDTDTFFVKAPTYKNEIKKEIKNQL